MFEEEGTARTRLLSHLGFTIPDESSSTSDLGEKLENTLKLHNSLVDGDANSFAIDNGEEFFNNPQINEDSLADDVTGIPPIGEQAQREPKEPTGTYDASLDEGIQCALVVGDYKGAVLQCIGSDRMADALVIAHAGGSSLWETTRNQYLKNSLRPYLKVVSAIASNNLMTLVNTRPLNSWKETLALLCTFAQKDEWTILCDSLASKLMNNCNMLAATLCYICAGNIDRTVNIWSHNLKSYCDGRTYADLLQDLMEKTIILALATGHKRFSATSSKLVENYAELLANQGLLTTAMEYLKLLGSEEPSHDLVILRDRIAFSSKEREIAKSPYETTSSQVNTVYSAEHTGFGAVNNSHNYYQDKNPIQPHPNVARTPLHAGGYQQSPSSAYVGYQHVQQKPQFPDYSNPAPFQPSQPAQMFIPTQANQVTQRSYSSPSAAAAQPTLKAFVPATPSALRNVEHYQQPSLGSQLYPGAANPVYQPGPPTVAHGVGASQPAASTGHRFAEPAATQAPRSFVTISNPNFVNGPISGHAQPLSPSKPAQAQSVAVPSAPPPTMQTVDTSSVTAELKPVITTLTRLYNETSAALQANPSKKREIDDNNRKIGSLFAKLNSGDISPNAANKLVQLCQALDAGDFAGALHIQVVLTTSDWDECNFWLAALKRMIKTRQSN
ncbi:hypothetical protein Cni_G02236 [Canna indica]|uniref:Sec16 Sec23-binding domain-containing protein n=1 Tax=Canna indica TaxID=4628 RepID=A0AAQ3JRT0_9LILI|nr:hypothetical protein Cni_G02236 [Canna indica]